MNDDYRTAYKLCCVGVLVLQLYKIADRSV